MALSHPRAQQIATPVAALLGLTGLAGGIYGLADPLGFAGTQGLVVHSSAQPFASFAAARNLGSGLGLLALLYLGQGRAAGYSMLAGVSVALADAWICFKYGVTGAKAAGHAAAAVIVGVTGAVLSLA